MEIPPFRPHFIKFSKTVFYEVNLTSQCLHLEVLLISKSGSERGISNNADSEPGMYLNASVVFITNSSLLFRLAMAILCTVEDKTYILCIERNVPSVKLSAF